MTNPTPSALTGLGQQKITGLHLQRLACVYVRQSSLKQVEHNRESQVNQYQLAQRAVALGWHAERVQVIDADQGLSGQGSDYRQGFKDLVAAVSLGQVGIIFGYEVSRLARNNSDWYHLLDLAAVFGTLIADNDGIYDPRLFNDRLLLGLKGTMSEAELHLIRQRLDAGRLSQVRRGVYRQRLPTGYVRLPDGTVEKDPDDQVRHTIALVFSKFVELGSCYQVLRWFRQEQLLLPRFQTAGFHAGRLLWKPPSEAAIYDMLQNPAYAGTFAYGRRPTDPTRRTPGQRATGVVRKPQAEWIHVQQDVYPAYISWEQYLANQERLHQNAARYHDQTQPRPGAPRAGQALLQGLATCGRCGHQMRIVYRGKRGGGPRYICIALAKQFGEAQCQSLHGRSIDVAVVAAFFAALAPAQLNALDAILAEQQAECDVLERQWQERLARVRYDAQLAERQYDAVDPANRLVAAELERRWEAQLVQLQTAQDGYARFQQTPPPTSISPELRQQLAHISETLPSVWQGDQLRAADKKALLRSLIQRVILKRTALDTVEAKIVWVSGHYSVVTVHPPIHREQDVTGYPTLVSRIEALWHQGMDDAQIAQHLTAEGLRSARSTGVSPVAVQKIRLARGWYLSLHQSRKAEEVDGYWTPAGLAAQLGVERTWVYRRIYRKLIAARYLTRHPQSNIYLIRKDPELLAQLQVALERRPAVRRSMCSGGANESGVV